MNPLIVVTAGVQHALIARLRGRFEVLGPIALPLGSSIAALQKEQLSNVRAIVTLGSTVISQQDMAAVPQLGLIACTGVGYEGLDLAAGQELGIAFSHVPGASADSVADVACGLLIASFRQFPQAITRLRTDGPVKPWPPAMGLTGRRAGIYGLGAIGQRIAQRLTAFEMSVGYCSRNARHDVPYLYFDSVLSLAYWCDALVVCVPATASTVATVNASVLAALGRDGHLINVGRGVVVEAEDLCGALEQQVIAGAALDVFEPRYLPRLLRLPNALVTPHIGGATLQSESKQCEVVLANLEAFFTGRPLVSPIPP